MAREEEEEEDDLERPREKDVIRGRDLHRESLRTIFTASMVMTVHITCCSCIMF